MLVKNHVGPLKSDHAENLNSKLRNRFTDFKFPRLRHAVKEANSSADSRCVDKKEDLKSNGTQQHGNQIISLTPVRLSLKQCFPSSKRGVTEFALASLLTSINKLADIKAAKYFSLLVQFNVESGVGVNQLYAARNLIMKLLFSRLLAYSSKELRGMVTARTSARLESQYFNQVTRVLQTADLSELMSESSAINFGEVSSAVKAPGTIYRNTVERLVPMIFDMLVISSPSRNHTSRVSRWNTLVYLAYSVATYLSTLERLEQKKQAAQSLQDIYSVFSQALEYAQAVRELNGAGFMRSKVLRTFQNNQDKQITVTNSLHSLNLMQKTILQLGTLLTILLREKEDSFIVTALDTLHTLQRIETPLHFMGTMIHVYLTQLRHLQILGRLLSLPQETDADGAKPLVINRGSVRFDNVSFRYSGSNNFSLRNVNLQVPGKAKIAIVGPSGAGKTTLVKLVARLFSSYSGSISICNQELRSVTIDSIRRQVGFVSQSPFLFSGTVRENLLFAHENQAMSDNEINAIAQQYGFQDFLDSIGGLDYEIGVRGQNLSAGQRQLLALLRVCLRDVSILILDEPTANLDAVTRTRILDTIQRFAADKTLLFVTHDLPSTSFADEIIVLDSGQIVERGTYSGLMKRESIFRTMAENITKNSINEEKYRIYNGNNVQTKSCASEQCCSG